MHVNQQRAAGDDLGDLGDLLGTSAGAGYPSARSSGRQRSAPGSAAMHQAKDSGAGDKATCRHRGGLRDRRGATRHDLATVGRRLVGKHRNAVKHL